MNMTINTRQVRSITIVDINGRIVLEECALLRDVLSNLLAAGHRKILLNLAGANRVDTAGLAYLISGLVSTRKQQGELKLLSPAKNVREVLRFTKLDTFFEIIDDEAAALMSFSDNSAAANA
jgi:anti-sigma B factor antagonist